MIKKLLQYLFPSKKENPTNESSNDLRVDYVEFDQTPAVHVAPKISEKVEEEPTIEAIIEEPTIEKVTVELKKESRGRKPGSRNKKKPTQKKKATK